jgi:hypothetical protein
MSPRDEKPANTSERDPLAAYRRVRKRVPPPGRVLPDRRDKLRDRAERRDRDAEGDG